MLLRCLRRASCSSDGDGSWRRAAGPAAIPSRQEVRDARGHLVCA